MPKPSAALWVFTLVLAVLLVTGMFERPQAYQSLFFSRCQSCHNDDTPTCAGCHYHRGTLLATSDQAVYRPDQPVTITLGHTGSYSGWIRGILYDHTGAVVDLATGPTGTGDDGLGNPIQFPVTLQADAPAVPGPYTWEAAWYGGNNTGTGHLEVRRPVSFTVEPDPAETRWPAPEDETMLRLDVRPNPIISRGRIRYSAPPGTRAALVIVDASGRRVRSLPVPAPGSGEISWDGRDDAGRAVAAGTYLVRLGGPRGTISHPLLVLR